MANPNWTYSGNPGASAKDLTRFLLGDTDACDPLLLDGEILWLLSQYNNTPMNAAIRACETIIAKFSRLADETVGSVSVSYSQKAKGMRDMQATLRQRLATEDCTPFAGGISVAQEQATAANKDRVKPAFTDHMMENEQISPWVQNTTTANPLDTGDGSP